MITGAYVVIFQQVIGVLFTIALALFAAPAFSQTNLQTVSGAVFKNARVVSVQPNGLVIEYEPAPKAKGMTVIRFDELPEPMQKQYGYDRTKAASYEAGQAAANTRHALEIERREYEAKVKIHERKQRELEMEIQLSERRRQIERETFEREQAIRQTYAAEKAAEAAANPPAATVIVRPQY